ncbi:DUF4012 domain-containing protein [Microbacterium sp.]|uniref:DUF4012 domain-containing protein n=1 Tax=Microbacterium sp. TaxID=51671 RepID=UPI0039E274BB
MSDGRLPARRRWVGWTIGLLAVLLLLAVGWVAVRGLGAVNDLQQVARISSQLKAAVGAGDLDRAEVHADSIAHHARSAHELTSDPVWQAFGVVPWIGPNFTAMSEVAALADDIAQEAVTPVLDAAGGIDLSSLGFAGGAIDLAPFAEIEPPLASAAAALQKADRSARQIDADAVLPPLADAVRELRSTLTQATTVVGTLHGASVLLPTMLGGTEPRSILLAMQNNAEVRSSGGISGATALLRAENGRVTLVQQGSSADFPRLDVPLPLSASTTALFGENPGYYLQNITSIPDFTEAAPLIATRWQDRFGTPVDAVIAVDAVMTKHILAATGPISFGPFVADEDNVVPLLLSDVYATVDPAQQDGVFAAAAGAMFAAAMSAADPKALVSALAASSDEGRIRIWSAHEEEQKVLSASTLGGALPTDSDAATYVGALFNDATGGKMDYYARASVVTAVGVCEGEPTTQVKVTWTNDAPADAATALPEYVTAAGWYGVPPGSTRTLIAVYGPEGATATRIDRDGESEPVQTTTLGSRYAVQHDVTLAPGESTTITVEFQGTGAGARLTEVAHTPLVDEVEIRHAELRCGS